MTSRRHILRSRSGPTAATIALLVVAAPAITARAQTSIQALMIGDAWSGWVNQASVLQTAMPTGGIAAQVTIRTDYVAPPLVELMAMATAGKSPLTTLQLATFSPQLAPLSGMRTGGTRIQAIQLPAADARSTSPAYVTVKFAQTKAEQTKPTTSPRTNPREQVLRSNYFHLSFDSLEATTTIAVAPLTITPGAVERGLPNLVLTTSAANSGSSRAWSAGLQRWFASRMPRNGTLTFFAPDMSTPLLVERFRGVRVASIVSGGNTPTVTLTLTGVTIQRGAMP